MNLKPFSDDAASLAVAVGWLHPQVPEVAKDDVQKAADKICAAKLLLIEAQNKIDSSASHGVSK